MKLRLPPGSFGAYLFDCDGTIVDSMPLHYMAWKKALAEWNCAFDEQLFYAWGGTPVAEIVFLLNEQQGLSMSVETVSSRKENFYRELLPQLQVIPEVLEHIDAQTRTDSFCGRLGQHPGIGNRITGFPQAPRQIRHHGLRRRLPEEQARPGMLPPRSLQTRSRPRSLSGF
jgi:Haloacid dehalogenase-like hydrolase